MIDTQDPGIMQEYLDYLKRTGLPFGSPMTFVPQMSQMGLQSASLSASSQNYRVIEKAIREGLQVGAYYRGHKRLFCPHVVGYSSRGRLNVFAYQYGGTSSSGKIEPRSIHNWRSFVIDELKIVGTREGRWRSAPVFPDDLRRSVAFVLLEAEHPEARHREWVDRDTGEIYRAARGHPGGVPTPGERRPRPNPGAPPPHTVVAVGAVHTGLVELAHDFEVRKRPRIVCQLGDLSAGAPDLSGMPAFNTVCMRLPGRLPGRLEGTREVLDALARLVGAGNPWVFILESHSPISSDLWSLVCTEANVYDYAVKGAVSSDPGGNRIYAIIGNRGA